MKQILSRTHLLLANAICVMSIMLISTPSFALHFNLTNANNIVADGFVDTDEWADASWEADPFGNGSMYAMYREDYEVDLGSYTGGFQFLLHNIEQLTEDNDWDYNVFDNFKPDDPFNVFLRIYIFDNVDSSNDSWFEPSGLKSLIGGTTFDDRGFLVYNYEESTSAHWLPEYNGPEDGGYVWDDYWDVYAAGGFNNSAYEAGLNHAVDGDNELYEVIYNGGWGEQIWRIGDPVNDDPDASLVVYWGASDGGGGTITPEPTTIILLGLGTLALRRRKRRT